MQCTVATTNKCIMTEGNLRVVPIPVAWGHDIRVSSCIAAFRPATAYELLPRSLWVCGCWKQCAQTLASPQASVCTVSAACSNRHLGVGGVATISPHVCSSPPHLDDFLGYHSFQTRSSKCSRIDSSRNAWRPVRVEPWGAVRMNHACWLDS